MEIITLASGSKGNAYTVSDGKTTLLLEAGLPVHKLCITTDLSKIDACLISHEHLDHARGAAEIMNRYCIPTVASAGTLNALRLQNSFQASAVADREDVRVGTMTVKAFAVPHDAAEPLGFLIKSCADGCKLMFITDAYYIPIRAPQGLTHLMVECNHSVSLLDETIALGDTPHEQRERIRHSHLSLETLCDWLRKNEDRLASLREIRPLHISGRNGDPQHFRDEIRRLTGKMVT